MAVRIFINTAVVSLVAELSAALKQASDGSLILGAFVSVNSTNQVASGNRYDLMATDMDFLAGRNKQTPLATKNLLEDH